MIRHVYPCRSSRAAEDECGHAVGATNVSGEELRPHCQRNMIQNSCVYSLAQLRPAPELLSQSSRACELQLLKPACSRALKPQLISPCVQLLKPPCLELALPNKRSHCNEKLLHSNWRGAPHPLYN